MDGQRVLCSHANHAEPWTGYWLASKQRLRSESFCDRG